jgi:tripartite-type tricarboxylate transporter receptor subunit TctC
VLNRLSAEMKKVLENPAVKDKFAAQGFAAVWASPKQSADYVRAEVDKWRQAVAQSGAKVE